MEPENYWGFGAISNTCPTLPNNGHCSYSSIKHIHRGCTLQDDAQQKKIIKGNKVSPYQQTLFYI
jgi:hypothetical protein